MLQSVSNSYFYKGFDFKEFDKIKSDKNSIDTEKKSDEKKDVFEKSLDLIVKQYQDKSQNSGENKTEGSTENETKEASENRTDETTETKTNNSSENGSNKTDTLTDEEKALVNRLKVIDAKVKAHEQAHLAAGGNLVRGGASFEYDKGPDGRNYAVAGEVQIDTSAVAGNPEATISKMQQVRRAALAPADPSAQDRKVAQQASQSESAARLEASQKNLQQTPDNRSESPKVFDKIINNIYNNNSLKSSFNLNILI